jgi:hypothetical protein
VYVVCGTEPDEVIVPSGVVVVKDDPRGVVAAVVSGTDDEVVVVRAVVVVDGEGCVVEDVVELVVEVVEPVAW